MSHDLTVRADGRVEMAYVGKLPWHRLGQQVTPGASPAVWAKEAGLDWEACEAVVQYNVPTMSRVVSQMREFEGRKVIYRSDTGAPLGDVSSKYNVVQPAAVLELFRDLTEVGGWHIHTAGSMRGGSKIWVMASAGEELAGTVGKHDHIRGNLLVATSLDGSMKTVAKLIKTRAVCANTMAIALAEAGAEVRVSHRQYFDADEVKRSLEVSVDAFARFMHQANELAETPVKLDEAREFLRQLFGQPTSRDADSGDDQVFKGLMAQFTGNKVLREQRSVQRCLSLFTGEGKGSALPGSPGTRWGLLNSITQHVDHERGRTDDTRMDSAWFGKGDEIKSLAFELLTA